MAAKKKAAAPKKKPTARSSAAPGADVDAYLAALVHPHRDALLAYRDAIRRAAPDLREELKWNAPSFALDDHFATFRLHPAPAFQLILHTGAKARGSTKKFALADPSGIVRWAAPDRAVVTLPTAAGATEKRAVVAMVTRWREQL